MLEYRYMQAYILFADKVMMPSHITEPPEKPHYTYRKKWE